MKVPVVAICYLHLFSARDTEGSAAHALMLFRPLGGDVRNVSKAGDGGREQRGTHYV